MHRTRRSPERVARRRHPLAALFAVAILSCAAPAPSPPTPDPAAGRTTVGTLVTRAEKAREDGDFDTAIEAYREALERTPWNTRLQNALATTHAERAIHTREEEGVFGLEAAERDLREAHRVAPERADIRRNLAVVLVERAVRESDPERAAALREEAGGLDPEIATLGEGPRPDIERRLDLAYELVERGQIDMGIRRLEALHREHPEDAATARLLAQALSRKAALRADRGRQTEAAELLDRAVEVYADLVAVLPPDERDPSITEEIRATHHNRIVSWLNASRPEAATRALEDAERAGFEFPELARAVQSSR
jgi:tetratricopeptide (TPR) repeat protein